MNCAEFFARPKDHPVQKDNFILYGDEVENFVKVPERYSQDKRTNTEEEIWPMNLERFEEDFSSQAN